MHPFPFGITIILYFIVFFNRFINFDSAMEIYIKVWFNVFKSCEVKTMEKITEMLKTINEYVWGLPLIIALIGIGIFLSFRVRFIQIFQLPKAIYFMFKNEKGTDGGDISSFASVCTSLSATIGTGNIVGVATAVGILAGGPGALFWMWVAAFFGMATKYSECFLAVKYRKFDADGHALGGPFYYIEYGMGKRWKWLAKSFAFFGAAVGLFGIGTFAQINGISSAVQDFFDPEKQSVITIFGKEYSLAVVISGAIVTIGAALVIIGGIKRISSVSEVIVPFMAGTYVLAVISLLVLNVDRLPGAISAIFRGAFNMRSALGGTIPMMFVAMQKGIARGIFSNEAGLGSAPMIAAAAKTNEPARQGLVSMMATFIDTIVICTMTGLAIMMMGSYEAINPVTNTYYEGVEVTLHAFKSGFSFLPSSIPGFVLMICLVFFAFTSILGWNYYGECCMRYLANGKKWIVMLYRYLFILALAVGPYLTVTAVWTVADIFNALMALPNLISLIALNGVVAKDTRAYVDKLKRSRRIRMISRRST